MRLTSIFEAVRDGNLNDVKALYTGDINEIDTDLDINLLCMAMTNVKNPDEKLKIINFLIEQGIDINYCTQKEQRNALHMLFFCNFRPDSNYALTISELLIQQGILLNKQDSFNAIPLKYALTINKLPTNEIKPLYELLVKSGSNYNLKDKFGKSCLDYAKEYAWRNGFVEIVEEFENDNK